MLRADRPWDRFALGWYSIVDDDGTYKMWYYGAERDPRPTRIAGETAPLGHLTGYVGSRPATPRERLPAQGRFRLCYAESHDGLEWEKPELGAIEFDGSKRNNIVHEDFKLAYVFLDPHGPESERFKLIHWTGPGIAVTTSADGLSWDRPSRQVSMLAADTQKMAWWEPRLNRYVVYLRVMVEEDNQPMFPFVDPIDSDPPGVGAEAAARPRRAVGRVEVDDLLSPWPEEEIRTVFAADEHDPARFRHLHARAVPLSVRGRRLLHVPDDLPALPGRRVAGAQRRAQRQPLLRQPRRHPLDAVRPAPLPAARCGGRP